MKIKYYYIVVLLILSPAIFAVLRKVWPGQPNWFEVMPSVVIALFIPVFIYKKDFLKLPKPFALIWLSILIIYFYGLLVAVSSGIAKIGLLCFILRCSLMFLVPMVYFTFRTPESILKFANILSIFCIIVAVGGLWQISLPEHCPTIFSATEQTIEYYDSFQAGLTEYGVNLRSGIREATSIFASNAKLSYFAYSSLFILMACIFWIKTYRFHWDNRIIWIGIISAFILLVIANRRGLFISGILGILLFYKKIKIKHKGKIALIFIAAFLLFLFNDYFSTIEVGKFSRFGMLADAFDRGILIFRIQIILDYAMTYIYSHLFLGGGMGSSGQEAVNLKSANWISTEMGIIQWIIEYGLFPMLLVLSLHLRLIWKSWIFRKRLGSEMKVIAYFQLSLFLLFLLKEVAMFGSGNASLLFFWVSVGIVARWLMLSKTMPIYI